MTNKQLEEFNSVVRNFLNDGQYTNWLITQGRMFRTTSGIRDRENFVRGCENNLWLKVEVFENSVKLYADSDSVLTLGIVHVLQQIVEDAAPSDVENFTMYDLGDIVAPLSTVRKKGTQSILNYIHAAVDKYTNEV